MTLGMTENTRGLSLNSLPFELLVNTGFLLPSAVGILSIVSRRLRSVSVPFVFSCITCRNEERLCHMQVFFAQRSDLAQHIRTLNVLIPVLDGDQIASFPAYRSQTLIEAMPHLTTVTFAGVPINQRLMSALCRMRHIHTLRLQFVLQFPPRRYTAFTHIPAIETLRISSRCYYPDDLQYLLQITAPRLKNLCLQRGIEFDPTLASLNFPRLEGLTVDHMCLTTQALKLFFDRHPSLKEANIGCREMYTPVCLSFVSRLIRGVEILDDTGALPHKDDKLWGRYFVGDFAYVVQDMKIGQNSKKRIVTELAFSLPEMLRENGPAEEFSKILPALDSFPDLRVLFLWSDFLYGGVFSVLMEKLGEHLRGLLSLRKLILAWTVSDMRWAEDDRHIIACPYEDEELDGEIHEDSDDDMALPYCFSKDGPFLCYRWLRWEAKNY